MNRNWKRTLSRTSVLAGLAVAAMVFASTPTQAGSSSKGGTIELGNTGVEPQASGTASVTHVDAYYDFEHRPVYSAKVTVTCRNLTPGATYSTYGGTFTANGKGNGRVSADATISVVYDPSGWWMPGVCVDVYRVNPDGSLSKVLVGTVHF